MQFGLHFEDCRTNCVDCSLPPIVYIYAPNLRQHVTPGQTHLSPLYSRANDYLGYLLAYLYIKVKLRSIATETLRPYEIILHKIQKPPMWPWQTDPSGSANRLVRDFKDIRKINLNLTSPRNLLKTYLELYPPFPKLPSHLFF